MNTLWSRTLGAIFVCCVYYALARLMLGDGVWAFLPLVIGLAFSRILIDVAAELGWRTRQSQLQPLSGSHYQFQNVVVHVIEDDDHCRWLATHEIRQVVRGLVSDSVLAARFPVGYKSFGKLRRGHLRDDAVIAHLTDLEQPQAIKFKNWVEHSIALPARTLRDRLGIRIADATSPLQD